MKREFLMALGVMLIICSTFMSAVSAEEFPILDRQVEIRQAHLAWISAVQETSMEAIIAYIDEISNGTGTSELTLLRDDFKDQTDEIETLTTHIALNEALRQLQQITADFRVEGRKQMSAYNGKYAELAIALKDALAENKETLDNLEDTYWETRKTNALEIFDLRVENAQTILDTLENLGYSTSEAQAKLDEITVKKSDLETALENRDNLEIYLVNVEILELSEELAEIVRDLQIEIPEDILITYWLDVGTRVVERIETIISEIENLGIDITELQAIHERAETDLEEAQDAFDARDLDGAIAALEDLKTDLIELREAYDALVVGGSLPADVAAEIETTSATLSETLEEMEMSL